MSLIRSARLRFRRTAHAFIGALISGSVSATAAVDDSATGASTTGSTGVLTTAGTLATSFGSVIAFCSSAADAMELSDGRAEKGVASAVTGSTIGSVFSI